MSDSLQELEDALSLIREAVVKKQPLNRYHARATLLPLGALLAGANPDAGRAAVTRLRELVRPTAETWKQAVHDELEMAVTEFAKSVDRRYLSRPDYDFTYTIDARERLEERLKAVHALGLELTKEWERELARADRDLAQHRARRAGSS